MVTITLWPGSPVPGILTGVDYHFLLQCMKVKSESEVAQSCLTLRDPMDCSLPGSSIHGIFQARVLDAMQKNKTKKTKQKKKPGNLITDIFANDFSKKSIYVSIWADIVLLDMHTLICGLHIIRSVRPTVCDTMECSLSGSSVYGIFQARILEWAAMTPSTGSSWPRDQTHVSCISCIPGWLFTADSYINHCKIFFHLWSNPK